MHAGRRFEILTHQSVYDGFFRLLKYRLRHTLFAGGWSRALDRELFQRGDCVAVLPYDPVLDQVVLIEQFRVGAIAATNPWLIEIVAGAVEAGETCEQVALRETAEEAGCNVEQLLPIYRFYTSPGGASEQIMLYLGIVDCRTVGGLHGVVEEGEDIRVEAVAWSDAMRRLDAGEICSAIPILALQWLALHRERVRSEHNVLHR